MKGTLKLEDGRELTVEINENTLKSIEKPKKTGYERVKKYSTYYSIDYDGQAVSDTESAKYDDDVSYDIANYYSDEIVAKNNARADALMRKLRRFTVEHRKEKLDWKNYRQPKWYIEYLWDSHEISATYYSVIQDFGQIYFDTKETAQKAIEEFKDELIWYFTEYKDSL